MHAALMALDNWSADGLESEGGRLAATADSQLSQSKVWALRRRDDAGEASDNSVDVPLLYDFYVGSTGFLVGLW